MAVQDGAVDAASGSPADDLETPEDERFVRLGVVQFEASPGDVAGNLAQAHRYVVQLAEQGADLVVLPEMFASGYDLGRDLAGVAEPLDGPSVTTLTGWARAHDLVIATALLIRDEDGGLVDTAVVIDGDGVAAASSKRFLWGGEREAFVRGPGDGALAKTRFGNVGVAICYEAGFPEVVRDLAVRGAEILAVPAAFGRGRLYAWNLLTRSRALENGCFLAAAGLAGQNLSGVSFAAHSRVVSPTGDIVAGLGEGPGAAVAHVDLADIDRARKAIPYLRDLTDAPTSPSLSVGPKKEQPHE